MVDNILSECGYDTDRTHNGKRRPTGPGHVLGKNATHSKQDERGPRVLML